MLPPFTWSVLVAWNAVAFVAMVWDKRAARRRGARVPERVLLGMAWALGATGVLAAMLVVRHKVRKPAFVVGVPSALLAQLAAAYALGAFG